MWRSTSQIDCVVPGDVSGNVTVDVSNDGYVWVSGSTIDVSPYSAFSITPSSGRSSGGSLITLTGSKFSRSDNVVVRFDRSLIVAVSGFGSNREYAYFLSPNKASVSDMSQSITTVEMSKDGGYSFMGSASFSFSDD